MTTCRLRGSQRRFVPFGEVIDKHLRRISLVFGFMFQLVEILGQQIANGVRWLELYG